MHNSINYLYLNAVCDIIGLYKVLKDPRRLSGPGANEKIRSADGVLVKLQGEKLKA